MSTTMSDSQVQQLRNMTLLIAPNTELPSGWTLDGDPVASGWCRVLNTFSDRELDRELGGHGWTFLFMAGAIKTTAFGWSTPRMVTAAVSDLIAEARRQKCNCLQVDRVTMHSLLGIPYVRLMAHSRDIRRSVGSPSK